MRDPIVLAKPALDVGLMTNRLDENASLLADLGVAYDHLLKIGGGVHQHRYVCGTSVIKLNSHRRPLISAPTGFARLRFAAPVAGPQAMTTPDGVELVAVPPGHDDIAGVEVTWRTGRPDEVRHFLSALGATEDGSRHRLGESFVVVASRRGRPLSEGMDALGFRYLTVQVTDVEAAHAHLLSLGFEEGRAPIRLGNTAYISFVRTAEGDWTELSQRASLTGPLPDVPPERHRR